MKNANDLNENLSLFISHLDSINDTFTYDYITFRASS